MSETSHDSFDPQLLDLHLGQLDERRRSEVESRLARDASLAAQHQELTGVFNALASATAPVAPKALRARICANVSKHAARTAQALINNGGGERGLRLYSLRDILAVAAMVVFAVGLGVPSVLQMRARSQRIACSANLAQIGRGMQSYATAFDNSLPFAGWSGGDSWQPTDEPGVQLVPNRRHLYPLLSSRYVQAASFVCPSTSDVPMTTQQVPLNRDFVESRNVSYANQNMAGVRPTLSDDPAMPILSDDNPMFSNGRPLINFAARTLGLSDPTQSNSRAHAGRGQNILTLGGMVKWTDTPFAGIGGDNIWTLSKVKRYTGREGPRRATDSHLLK